MSTDSNQSTDFSNGCLMAEQQNSPTAEELKQKADAEFEASLEGLSEEGKTAKRTEKEAEEHLQINYEAELAKEQERSKEKDKKLADLDFKLREKNRQGKKEGDEEQENDEDDKPITKKDLENLLSKNQQQIRQDLMGDTIKKMAKEIAQSDAEANFIVEIHKNRTWPQDISLSEQLEEAAAIANRKPFMAARKAEMERAKKNKENSSSENLGSFRDAQIIDEPKIDANAKKALLGGGFAWDGKRRLYVKTLSKDKILTYDSKTKVRKVIAK